jgi:hypothetical protein
MDAELKMFDFVVVTNHRVYKIWGFHGNDYEECRLLKCYAVWLL